MKLIIESSNMNDYLVEIPPIITFNTPMISQEIEWIKEQIRLRNYDNLKNSIRV